MTTPRGPCAARVVNAPGVREPAVLPSGIGNDFPRLAADDPSATVQAPSTAFSVDRGLL